MSYAIEIEGLRKVYSKRGRADVVAVEDLNLNVSRGQVFGFLGANGAGKTTTIKMACGLVSPASGRVRLNGFDVQRQRSQAMRQIGAVLEGTRNVYWRLTAWQNLVYFGRLKGTPHANSGTPNACCVSWICGIGATTWSIRFARNAAEGRHRLRPCGRSALN
ncbi:MAG: ATP-binding cassette domain-containing protein [Caldilineaceae bacterium]